MPLLRASKTVAKSFVATTRFALFAGYLVVSDVCFLWVAKTGQASVVAPDYHYRNGRAFAAASHIVDGHRVPAFVAAWYVSLYEGELVDVRYDPSYPDELILDQFWQLHFGSLISVAGLVLVATAEVLRFQAAQPALKVKKRRRRRRRPRPVSLPTGDEGVALASCVDDDAADVPPASMRIPPAPPMDPALPA